MRRAWPRWIPVLVCVPPLALACKSTDSGPTPIDFNDSGLAHDGSSIDSSIPSTDGATDASLEADASTIPNVPVVSQVTSTRVDTQKLMFASGEMQISGEPFAENFMGRNLDGYDRSMLPPNLYSPDGTGDDTIEDVVGFSTAVESYEYSKYSQNMVAFESFAGPSLAWGPVVNGTNDPSTDLGTVQTRLQKRFAKIVHTSSADLAGFGFDPPPASNPLNTLGFSGIHPILAPYRSFDAAMTPDNLVSSCTFAGGYATFSKAQRIPDYECGYASLELTNRATMDFTLDPGVIGLATWKESLWSIDFVGRLHDAGGSQMATVSAADAPNVGTIGNQVVAQDDTGADGLPGTYIGSVPLEGMWGLTMIEEMDNVSAFLLGSLSTTDGLALSAVTPIDATNYDYTSPPRWFPAAIAVTEGPPAEFPQPTAPIVADPSSNSEDLAAILLGESMLFGMTDARNTDIGGRIGLQVTFDGDPFPSDDGLPNGEATTHDRALALMRLAFVDLDALHTVPFTSVIGDAAFPAKTGPDAHGTTVTTTTLAHVTIALRQALLSVNAAITQYGGADPSPAGDTKGILNTVAIHPPGATITFSSRVRAVAIAQATFVRDVVTTADGGVANFVTFDATGKPTVDPSTTTLASQTAAIRALLEGFLVNGDSTFVDRARACYKRLEKDFYSPGPRLYRAAAGADDAVTMDAERFAFLQSAIREVHKIAHLESDPVLARNTLETRIGRVNKLYLNGWDDVNDDGKVDTGTECIGGGLQLGEQALTGEYGKDDKTGDLIGDRDQDCVQNISWSHFGSFLAGEVKFAAKK